MSGKSIVPQTALPRNGGQPHIKAINLLTALLVLSLAIGAFILSYHALLEMALTHGITGWLAYIWPLLIDASLVVFSLAVLRASLNGERTLYPWLLVSLYTIATIVFNILHAPADIVARIIAAVAPVSLFLSFELLMSMTRTEVTRAGLVQTVTELAQEKDKLQAEIIVLDRKIDQAQDKLQDTNRGQIGENTGNVQRLNQKRQAKMEARRQEVAALLDTGKDLPDIAQAVGVTVKTVKRDIMALNGRQGGQNDD